MSCDAVVHRAKRNQRKQAEHELAEAERDAQAGFKGLRETHESLSLPNDSVGDDELDEQDVMARNSSSLDHYGDPALGSLSLSMMEKSDSALSLEEQFDCRFFHCDDGTQTPIPYEFRN